MKRLMIWLLALGLVGSMTVMANEAKKSKGKAKERERSAKVELQDLTVVGQLAKQEGKGFSIKEADGSVAKIMIKSSDKECGDLDALVGKTVELVGKGMQQEKDGKKRTIIKEIVSVKETEAAEASAQPAEESAAPAEE